MIVAMDFHVTTYRAHLQQQNNLRARAVAREFRAAGKPDAEEIARLLPLFVKAAFQGNSVFEIDTLRVQAEQGVQHLQSSIDAFNQTERRTYQSVIEKFKSKDILNILLTAEGPIDQQMIDRALEQYTLKAILDDAGEKGRIDVVKFLFESGINKDEFAQDVLVSATNNNHISLVQYVMEAVPYVPQTAALISAAMCGNLELMKCFSERKRSIIDDWVEKAFSFAAAGGHITILEYMAEQGMTAHIPRSEAIRLAAENGHLAIVQYLIKQGGGPFISTKTTSFAGAAINGHLDVMQYLAENGADIHHNNDIAFRSAARGNNLAGVQYLVESGVDVNVLGGDALAGAILTGNEEMIKYLLKQGADINLVINKLSILDFLYNNFMIRHAALDDGYDCNLERAVLLQDHARRHMQKLENWQSVARCDPPDGLIGFSPHGFRPVVFKAIVEMLSHENYHGLGANMCSYHMSRLFHGIDDVLAYLEKWGNPNSKQPLHDLAIHIKTPEVPFNVKAWRDAVMRCGPGMAKLVKFADRVEKPESNLSATRDIVKAFAYERAAEHPELAGICMEHDVDEKDFNTALDLYQEQARAGFPSKRIPQIKIEGDRFGMPGARFYRLAENDPRGLFLGEYTDCCQSIGGDGAQCAMHGFTSKNGGFYVVTDARGKIIGQSWAWIGHGKALVLDSLETLGNRVSTESWRNILQEMAKGLAKKPQGVTGLLVGTGGATPKDIGGDPNAEAIPKDYSGYRDSECQVLFWSKSEPQFDPFTMTPS